MIENKNIKIHLICINNKSKMRWILQSKKHIIINDLKNKDNFKYKLKESITHQNNVKFCSTPGDWLLNL